MQRKKNITAFLLIFILSISIVTLTGCSLSRKNTILEPGKSSDSNTIATISTEDLSALEPEAKAPLVVIDAGHGGWDPGAGKEPNFEKDIVLALSLEIEKKLNEKNIESYMIRTDDTYVSLEDRAYKANELGASLFISIHNNSFEDPAQSGILTSYNPNSSIGKEIATIMQSKISDIGMKNRDIVPRPNLYVLRHTEMPALLLEIGFISSNKDLKLLTDVNFQEKCATQIATGIEDILNQHLTDEVKTPLVE